MTRDLVRRLVRRLGSTVPAPSLTPSTRREVILLRPDHLGDALLTIPALRALRATEHQLYLTLLVGPWAREVFTLRGLVDEVLVAPFPGFRREPTRNPFEPYGLLLRLAGSLRRRGPMALVVLRDDHWWGAWLGALAGVPLRVGADHPAVRPFLTHPIPLRSRHVAAQNLELVTALLTVLGYRNDSRRLTPEAHPLTWPHDPGAARTVRNVLERYSIVAPYIVVHPGSGAPAKCWPEERWATLVDELAARGYRVLLTGSASEYALLAKIVTATHSRPHNLAGKLSLSELAELLREAALVIGTDTGPLHLAVAVGSPTVHLFGPTRPERFGPWGPRARHRVLHAQLCCPRCGDIGPDRACGTGCMMAIDVGDVLRAALELLESRSTR
ncbi:glycosyltransferase family 9 protein [Thermomicrobium sp.]